MVSETSCWIAPFQNQCGYDVDHRTERHFNEIIIMCEKQRNAQNQINCFDPTNVHSLVTTLQDVFMISSRCTTTKQHTF